jgi:multidrug efflux pump subunit AcrB
VRGIDGVAGTVTIGGTSLLTNSAQPNAGSLVVILDPWEERKTPERSVETIIGKMMGKFAQMPEAFIFPSVPRPSRGWAVPVDSTCRFRTAATWASSFSNG